MTNTKTKYSQAFKRFVVSDYMNNPHPHVVANKFSLHHSTVERWVREFNSGNCDCTDAVESDADSMSATDKALCGGDDYSFDYCDFIIDELLKRAERKYLAHLLKTEKIKSTSTKDAAVIFKTLAEIEIKRSAQKLLLKSAKREGEKIGEEGDEIKPELMDWERVLRRLMSEDDGE